jgi:phosphoenolpyruvate synthase/pyruvate phosphate dikinase
MSYKEAIKDNIKISKNSRGDSIYYPKCCICGSEVKSLNYIPKKEYRCERCKGIKKPKPKKHNYSKRDLLYFEQKLKLDEAIKNISRFADIHEYQPSINWIKDNLCILFHFQCVEEAMIVIELVKIGISDIYRLGSFKHGIRLILQNEKIMIEIIFSVDNWNYENYRSAFGVGLEIIRIPTKNIDESIIKLSDEILSILIDRGRVRRRIKF